jgi:single-strand DNA-binding protein
MSNGNSVTLVGNITRDPELRFTPSGQATASFGLAVNRIWNDRQTNERKEAVSFFDVVCWREMAENVSESLSKGARVVVTGRLEQRSWDGADGERRSKIEVVADEIGPSLRWATAEVRKNDRRGPSDAPGFGGQGGVGQGGGQGHGGGPGGQGGQGGQGGGNSYAPTPPAPAPPAYDYGEEPF